MATAGTALTIEHPMEISVFGGKGEGLGQILISALLVESFYFVGRNVCFFSIKDIDYCRHGRLQSQEMHPPVHDLKGQQGQLHVQGRLRHSVQPS